jgi:CubicO group peptidase (beta-lactamase class C family)
MRRSVLLCTTAVVLLLASASAHAQGFAFEVFDPYLDALRVQAGIPGLAAAVVGRDAVLWEHAYGQQDVARSIATRTDTPFHTDGLTQTLTATIILRCVEERRLSLDDRVGKFQPTSAEPNATIAQLLTHTSGTPAAPVFAYRLDRLDPLRTAVRACTDNSYRETLATLIQRLAMMDSVPGPDVVSLKPPAEGIPDPTDVPRYVGLLQRLATPYAINKKNRPSASEYAATTLTASSGLISTVRDLAKFDLALRQGVLLELDTLAAAWRAPVAADGAPLPHGMGWFVQTSGGETIAWQFGVGDNASSSLVMTLPKRGLTLILLANSDRLVRPFPLEAGDVTVSPFAKLFLSFFAR